MSRAALAVFVALTAFSAGARTRDVDPDTLIAQGLELRRAGKSAEALELFRRAHRQAPSPRTLGQMGLVEASLTHWLDADGHLSASLATPDDAWVRKNRPFLEQALDRARMHIGELVISGRPGAAVWLAGRALGVLPLSAVRSLEGNVSLTASAEGFKPFSAIVLIKGGARTAFAIVLDPLEASAVPDPANDRFAVAGASQGSTKRWAGLTLAAAGLFTLTWGVVWIELDNHNTCGSVQTGSCGTVYDTRPTGWFLTAGGTAAALVGGGLLFSSLHVSNADLTVALGPKSLQLEGRF
ncbi:MAG TPA: PEGA domain-containing protein [Polyangia bacterium]|nr:PEGA domain-containing protein [Polyangia bacterium]